MKILAYIPLVIFCLTLLGIIFLLIKKMPDLANLPDLPAKPDQVSPSRKNQIIHSRFNRVWKENLRKLSLLIRPFSLRFRQFFHSISKNIHEFEALHKGTPVKEDEKNNIQKNIWEAGELVNQGLFDQAEKKYIEIITQDHKNSSAYKGLAELYWQKKDYNLAKITFEHLLKINPADPETYWNLGALALEQGQNDSALVRLNRALELSPNNPKYIDSLLEACILLNKKDFAWKLVARLKEVNPENQKLDEFEDRIRAI